MIGGTGATLSLNLAMLKAKSVQIRKLGNILNTARFTHSMSLQM